MKIELIFDLILLALTVGSAAACWKLGIFRREGILGPRRWEGLPWFGILIVGLAGGMVWAIGSGLALHFIAGTATLSENPAQSVAALVAGYALGVAFIMIAGGALLMLRPRPAPSQPDFQHAQHSMPPSFWRQVGTGVLALALVWPIVMLVGNLSLLLLKALGTEIPTEHELITLLKGIHGPDRARVIGLVVLSAAVMAPLFEELLFRGLLQTFLVSVSDRLLAGRSNPTAAAQARWVSIVLTSCAFALLHPTFSWAAIGTLSLGLGYLYERTGRLLPSIVAHAGFNSISLLFAIMGWAG